MQLCVVDAIIAQFRSLFVLRSSSLCLSVDSMEADQFDCMAMNQCQFKIQADTLVSGDWCGNGSDVRWIYGKSLTSGQLYLASKLIYRPIL